MFYRKKKNGDATLKISPDDTLKALDKRFSFIDKFCSWK
jgi:hypothetical protein